MEIGDISYEKAEIFFYLSSPSEVNTCTRKIKKREGQKKHGEELLKQKWPGKDTARTSSTNYQRTKRGGMNCTQPMIHKEVMKACQVSQKNCLHNYTKPRLQDKKMTESSGE